MKKTRLPLTCPLVHRSFHASIRGACREHLCNFSTPFTLVSPHLIAPAMSSTQQARRALVVYGSETGNAQDVAEEMGRIAERLRFETEVAELNAISLVC
jgi:sulfite reductase alpha subunit-like flavoprotein